jgi:hypothetical protein
MSQAKTSRNKQIVALRAEGVKVTEIAACFGLSGYGVYKILRRDAARVCVTKTRRVNVRGPRQTRAGVPQKKRERYPRRASLWPDNPAYYRETTQSIDGDLSWSDAQYEE